MNIYGRMCSEMKRTLALFLSLTLLFLSAFCVFPTTTVYAATQQELQQQINELNGKISDNKEKLNELESKKKKNEEYLATLESQIEAVQIKANAIESQIKVIDAEIAAFDKQLKKLGNEISDIRQEIAENRDNIESTKDELSSLLRSSYINGDRSVMELFMGSHNLASLLTHLEWMKRTSENEKKVIDDFTAKIKKLKASQEKLQEKQEEVEETRQKSVDKKAELKEKKDEYSATANQLESNQKKVTALIDEIDQSSALYQSYIKKLQAQKAEADAEIDRIIKQNASTNSSPQPSISSDASWVFPISRSCYISSGYGYRDASISGWGFHGGIDITGGGFMGAAIYATRGGTVIAANYSTVGYGNYVIIDHGDGFSSLYGHCSSLAVSAGQSVSKGQYIASAGDTGNSSGPHLHFEIRYNGAKQNPLNYVSG